MVGLKRWLVPRTAVDWVTLAGFSLFLIGELLRRGPLATEAANLEWVARAIRDLGLTAAVCTMLIFGIRAIRGEGRTARRVVMVVAGAGLCVLLLAISLIGYQKLSERAHLFEFPKKEFTAKLNRRLDRNDLTPEDRAILSKILAKERYLVSGRLVEYVTPEGDRVRYTPTAEDIELRRSLGLASKQIEGAMNSLRTASMFWGLLLVVSTVVGLLTPISRRHDKG
ncbi:MAG: hypothetical protein ACE5JU_17565 [Candidatus Binatia bacterium]